MQNGPRMTHDYKVVKRQVERRRAEAGFSKEEEALERKKDLNDLSTFPIEHARLRSEPYFFFVLIASTITYGWVLDKGVHLSVPLIMQFFSKPFFPSGQALHERSLTFVCPLRQSAFPSRPSSTALRLCS